MWVRIAARYTVAHSPKKLALYRVHQNNITSRYFLSGQAMTDSIKVVDMIQNYLPADERRQVKQLQKNIWLITFHTQQIRSITCMETRRLRWKQSKRAMGMHLSRTTFLYWTKDPF